MNQLEVLRESLGQCDEIILDALLMRNRIVEDIMVYKEANNVPILQPEQEAKQKEWLERRMQEKRHKNEVADVFESITRNSKKIQARKLFNYNIVLIGFMGAGKSTISDYLKTVFAMDIIEMDQIIAERAGMSISDIFETYGEQYFRDCETNLLIEMQSRTNVVISCGGGTPMRECNVVEMKKNGRVVLLTAKPETILDRVKDSHDRPLIENNKTVPFIADLMSKRREKYEAAADIIIETDGKLMSGRDVAMAAALGAEEFGFATGPLITMGCVMMRVCNLDTCPVGIATQNPELRKRFKGKPEYVVNYMKFVAQEMREYMAKLGVRTVDELVGRTDLLKELPEAKEYHLDLSAILNNPYVDKKHPICYNKKNEYNFELEKTLDEKVLLTKLKTALDKKQKRSISIDVGNTDRSFGTIFGSEITKKYYDTLEDDTFTIQCTGAGGQSFGAFIPNGLTLELVGDSNDYFGKGLSGGKLIVYPPKGIRFKAEENIIVGNVALYGATSGQAYINGVAGERFCVRNSGATAVVEGVGDHGCEYMTGGKVLIIGKTGKNFAAGMSGGVAYVLDEDNDLYLSLNKEMVSSEPVVSKYDVMEIKDMITAHVAYTNSEKGKEILNDFSKYLPKFKKIIPHDYKKMLKKISEMEGKGLSAEQAQIEAFYEIKRG